MQANELIGIANQANKEKQKVFEKYEESKKFSLFVTNNYDENFIDALMKERAEEGWGYLCIQDKIQPNSINLFTQKGINVYEEKINTTYFHRVLENGVLKSVPYSRDVFTTYLVWDENIHPYDKDYKYYSFKGILESSTCISKL